MINCTPKLGGQFELESGGQFAPKLVVNLHWNRMVNLTGFSTCDKEKEVKANAADTSVKTNEPVKPTESVDKK